LARNAAFPVRNGAFPIRNGAFFARNTIFLYKNAAFSYNNGAFFSLNMPFTICVSAVMWLFAASTTGNAPILSRSLMFQLVKSVSLSKNR
jgi:hypothetical protein